MSTEAIRKPTPYQNSYRATLHDDEPDNEATLDQDPSLDATPDSSPPLSPEENTFKQRYDSLKTHYDSQVTGFRKKVSELETQLSKSHSIPLPKTPEEIAAWRTEYPDIYAIVRTIARLEVSEDRKQVDSQLQHVTNMAKQASRDKAEAILRRYHPDFDQLKADQNFHNWVKEQPAQIQSWLYENDDDPLLASKAINLYKAEKGITKAPRDSKRDNLNASMTVTRTQPSTERDTGSKRIWKISEISKLNPRQFEKFEAEIDLARDEGRLDYDN